MKKKLGDLWESIKLFWFSHKVDFYFGMALSVLVILSLVTFASLTTSLLICPVVTPLVYFSLWQAKNSIATANAIVIKQALLLILIGL